VLLRHLRHTFLNLSARSVHLLCVVGCADISALTLARSASPNQRRRNAAQHWRAVEYVSSMGKQREARQHWQRAAKPFSQNSTSWPSAGPWNSPCWSGQPRSHELRSVPPPHASDALSVLRDRICAATHRLEDLEAFELRVVEVKWLVPAGVPMGKTEVWPR
jgi:hypothetical protein